MDEIIEVPEENIFMDFELDGQNYIVFAETEELNEDDEIFFAKENIVDDIRLLRNIGSDDEYEKVVAEYERRLELLGDEEEDE